MIKRYIIEEESILLKDYLIKNNFYSNTLKDIKQLNGQYLVNDQIVENWYMLKKGDLLEIVLPASTSGNNIKSIKGDFEILYEDSYLLIINKENNVASIPTREHYEKSLANYVMSYYKRVGIVSNIHFVGRLDYATSGIIILAKNPYVMAKMKDIDILKEYILEVEGKFDKNNGIFECGIEKDPNSIIKRRPTFEYINSKTIYELIEIKENTSIIKATLVTGKTHQLRLHFSTMGFPILGDELYGNKAIDNILHLHSFHTKFIHPITEKEIDITIYPKWYNKQDMI